MKIALAYVPYIVGVLAIWCVSAMERPPVPESLVFWNSDKLMHAVAYAVLAALAAVAVLHRRGALSAASRVEVFCMSALYGVVDEVHQGAVPGRSSSLADVFADALGALLVAAIGLTVWSRLRRQPS